ncbi:putative glycosyltransferase [Burkholderiales bacterium JOSHI_001]|nr:putative glycosyltransferase [Burkholderiales bacterium JOSHI_001]
MLPVAAGEAGPLFTVVTVTFNAESLIDGTAASLRQQGFEDYEWLVVDGASRDQTLGRVEASGITRRRVVSEPDKGIYDAMNKAVRLARGRWIYFLNAGDALADPDVLADVARTIRQQPRAELIWGDMRFIGPGRDDHMRYGHVGRTTLPFEDLNHQAAFARRDLFQRLGHFNLAFRTSADYDWFLRVFRSGAATHYVPRVIGRFDVGGMHTLDPQALARERHQLRLQYVSPALLAVGLQVARVRRRWRLWRMAAQAR